MKYNILIDTVIPIRAIPQGDLCVTCRKGRPLIYNPARLKVYRECVKVYLNEYMEENAIILDLNPEYEYKLELVFCRKTEHINIPPDLDKLVRAIGDILTQNNMIHDDSQIVEISARKIAYEKDLVYIKLYEIITCEENENNDV